MHRTPRQISDELLSYTKKEGYYAPLLGKRPDSLLLEIFVCAIQKFHRQFLRVFYACHATVSIYPAKTARAGNARL